MSDHIRQTITDLQDELKKQEGAVIDTKRLINMLCGRAGMTPMFPDAQLQPSGMALSIKPDQFYGQSLVGVLRTILEMRKALDRGPATVNELYDAMVEGGYKFETKDEENAKRGLRISITKNTAVFHRIPSGRVGLTEWYPNAKSAKAKRAVIGDDHTQASDEDEEAE